MFTIAFEGANASGKTGLVVKTYDWLDKIGFKTKVVHFPNYPSCTGEAIGSLLMGDDGIQMTDLRPTTQAMLYAADRALWWVSESQSYENSFVIFDRYTSSSVICALASLLYNREGVNTEDDIKADVNALINKITWNANKDNEGSACRIDDYDPYALAKLIFITEQGWGIRRPDITIVLNRLDNESRVKAIAKRIEENGPTDSFESESLIDFAAMELTKRFKDIASVFDCIAPYKNIYEVDVGEGDSPIEEAFEQIKSIIINQFPFIKIIGKFDEVEGSDEQDEPVDSDKQDV